MASRKEELLSKLKNTLAIVMQATKYENIGSNDSSYFGSVNKTSTADANLSSNVPHDNVPIERPHYSNSSTPSASSSTSVENKHLMMMSGIPTIDDIKDVDDEDEFLYGNSQSKEKHKKHSLENDTLLSYVPEKYPDMNVRGGTGKPCMSSDYIGNSSGCSSNNFKFSTETGVSDFSSNVMTNMLKLVAKQSPDVCKNLEMDELFSESKPSRHESQLMPGQMSWHQYESSDRKVPAESNNPRSIPALPQPTASLPTSSIWTDLKTLSSSVYGKPGKEEKEKNQPVFRKVSNVSDKDSELNVTVDRVLQTLGLDETLYKAMQDKFKNIEANLVKEEQGRIKILERIRKDVEVAKQEAEERERRQTDEKAVTFAETLIQGLVKARENRDSASQRSSMVDLIAEKSLEKEPPTRLFHFDAKTGYDAGDGDGTEQKFPLFYQSAKHADASTNRLVSDNRLKTEGVAGRTNVPRSGTGIDPEWEHSTEEFLQKLRGMDDSKEAETKIIRHLPNEATTARLSQERGRINEEQINIKNCEQNQIYKHSYLSQSESDERRNRRSSEKTSMKPAERNFSRSLRYSRSPESRPELGDDKHLAETFSSVVRNEDFHVKNVREVTLRYLSQVQGNKKEKNKEEMKADIEALQAELDNLQHINSGLLRRASSETRESDTKVLKGQNDAEKESKVSSCSLFPHNNMVDSDRLKQTRQHLIRKEMLANISALEAELENLQRLKKGLLQRLPSKQRDAKIEENGQMQTEVEDHLGAMKRAAEDLTEHLLQESLQKPDVQLAEKSLVANKDTASMNIPKKSVPQPARPVSASIPSSCSVTVSYMLPQTSHAMIAGLGKHTIQDSLPLIKSNPIPPKKTENLKADVTEKGKKKSSNRSSSSSSSSSNSSSSSSSSTSSSSSSTGSSSYNRSTRRSRDRKSLKEAGNSYSQRKTESRNRSSEQSRSRDRNRGTNSKSKYSATCYNDRKRVLRYSRSRSRSCNRSRRGHRNKSPYGRRTRNRSRSSSAKTSQSSRSGSSNVKSGKAKKEYVSRAEDITKDSDSSKPAMKKETAEKKNIELNKAADFKITDKAAKICDEVAVLKEKKKCALELAMNMYARAEDYYDGGNLWCRKCDIVCADLAELCHHLHSDHHQIMLNPNYNKPKSPTGPKTINQSSVPSAPSRGDEFLLPLQAFFCSLCCEFSKDNIQAENHLKSVSHNNRFKQFLKENPSYEIKYLMDKMAALQQAKQPEKVSDSVKRKPDETGPESEVKRIKIMPLSQDMKPPPTDQLLNYGETIRKVTSGNLSKTTTEQQNLSALTKSGEKRVITFDKKTSSSQVLPRNPSPPSSVQGFRDHMLSELHSAEKAERAATKEDHQSKHEAGGKIMSVEHQQKPYKTAFSRSDIRNSPKSRGNHDTEIIQAKPKLAAFSDTKMETEGKSSISEKSQSANLQATNLFKMKMFQGRRKFVLGNSPGNLGKGRRAESSCSSSNPLPGKQAGKSVEESAKASFSFKDFEVYDECD